MLVLVRSPEIGNENLDFLRRGALGGKRLPLLGPADFFFHGRSRCNHRPFEQKDIPEGAGRSAFLLEEILVKGRDPARPVRVLGDCRADIPLGALLCPVRLPPYQDGAVGR